MFIPQGRGKEMVDKLEETLRDFEDAFYGGSLKQMREDGVEVVTTKWLRRRLQNLIFEERKKAVEEFVEKLYEIPNIELMLEASYGNKNLFKDLTQKEEDDSFMYQVDGTMSPEDH